MKLANKIPFEYVGYYCDKIHFQKSQSSVVNEIEIAVDTFNYDSDSHICSIGLKITIAFNDSKLNSIGYVTGHSIIDDEIRNLFTEYNKSIEHSSNKLLEDNEEVNRIISILLSSSFPFIRQHIFSITSDMQEPILLPTIDVRNINLSVGLKLNPRKKKEKK